MAEPARKIDIIDARPAFTQGDADALNARFEGIDTLTMLKTVFAEGLAGNVAVVSSFASNLVGPRSESQNTVGRLFRELQLVSSQRM